MIPAPSTPSCPVSTGRASTERNDAPPFRLRSSPHPMRMNAGRIDASSSANAAMSAAATPATSAVRSNVHSSAAAITWSAPVASTSTNASVDEVVLGEMTHHPEHQCDIGARPQRDVTIGAAGHRRSPGIDDDEPARPRARACWTSGGKWMLEIAGFAPQTITSLLCTTSCGSAESIDPNVDCHAAPAVAAQMVWSTRATPSSSKSRQVSPSAASSPADEL